MVMQRLMNSFVNKLFTRKSFESEFVLVSAVDGNKEKNIYMPEGVRYVVGALATCATYAFYATCTFL